MSEDVIGGAQDPPIANIVGGPGVRWRNKDGTIYFQMKRIDYQGRGDLYYIFTINREAMEEDRREYFDRVWPLILKTAKRLDIAFFDVDEIGERASEAIKGLTPWTGQKDIDIELYDHASGEVRTVTKGVTLQRTE